MIKLSVHLQFEDCRLDLFDKIAWKYFICGKFSVPCSIFICKYGK